METYLVDIIKESGIVGAGGAGFPTHVKINAKAEYVIVNGAECEPLLRVDQQLMSVKSKELVAGLDMVMKEVGATKGIIGLKGKYKDAISSLNTVLAQYPNISILEMGNFYPAGDEQILVYEATKRIVPEGGIPLNVGVIVINVETLINVYNAINGEKVTEKYITVTGEVKNPITVKVPIGIKISEVIELAGGTTVSDYSIIDGGPMMGPVIKDENAPVTKVTKGLIVLPKNHNLITTKNKSINNMLKEAKTACMNCNLCSEVCPRSLIGHKLFPHKIMRLASYNSTCDSKTSPTTAFLCCECRLCQYACVMNLQPWKLHKELKSQMSKNALRNPHKDTPEEAHPFREYRKYPVNKLIRQLELDMYDVVAPIYEYDKVFDKVELMLRQHIGAKAVPTVNEGDKVLKGDLVAQIDGEKLGANIHASIDGTILKVSDDSIEILRSNK